MQKEKLVAMVSQDVLGALRKLLFRRQDETQETKYMGEIIDDLVRKQLRLPVPAPPDHGPRRGRPPKIAAVPPITKAKTA